MVIKEVIRMSQTTPVQERRAARPRRLGVAEAKAHLSELLRDVASGPTVIHSRGRDVAVLVSVHEFALLEARAITAATGGASFLDRIERLRSLSEDEDPGFEPERVQISLRPAFGADVGSSE
jgi:prevent-host-death family protein